MSNSPSIVQDKTADIVKNSISGATESISSIVGSDSTAGPTTTSGSSSWYFRIFFAFVILSLIGINIFGYASLISETINEVFGGPFKQLGALFGFYTGETIKQTAEMSAEGTKFGADVAKDVVVNTIDAVGEQAKNTSNAIDEIDVETVPIKKEDEIDDVPYVDRDELMASFEDAKKFRDEKEEQTSNKAFIEDDAGSTIQNGRNANGKGWCYIGEDRGFRSCVEVGDNQECMSGDIFPTKDMCINPSLRH